MKISRNSVDMIFTSDKNRKTKQHRSPMNLQNCSTITLCRCCGDNFTTENPQSKNPNTCERCERLGLELLLEQNEKKPALNPFPKGRWN